MCPISLCLFFNKVNLFTLSKLFPCASISSVPFLNVSYNFFTMATLKTISHAYAYAMLKWQQWRDLKSLVPKQPPQIPGLSPLFATSCPDDSFLFQHIIFRWETWSCDGSGRMVQAVFTSSSRLMWGAPWLRTTVPAARHVTFPRLHCPGQKDTETLPFRNSTVLGAAS